MSNPDHESIVRLRTSVMTDVGLVRDHNEDAAYADTENEFFVVADGIVPVSEFRSHVGAAGLMRHNSTDGLRVVFQAPKLPDPAPDRSFLASLTRAALLSEVPFNPYRGKKGRAV